MMLIFHTIYGWIDNSIRREHRARGDFFASSSTTPVSNEFFYNSTKELPEISVTSNNVFIK